MFLPGTNVKTPKFADRIGKPIEIRGRSGPKRKNCHAHLCLCL
jgi:hypothetical protein